VSRRWFRTHVNAPSEGEPRHAAPPVPPDSWVFLPLTASDFRSGWALDWSPELRSSPLLTPPENVKRRA
jgi:hypothetical protein